MNRAVKNGFLAQSDFSILNKKYNKNCSSNNNKYLKIPLESLFHPAFNGMGQLKKNFAKQKLSLSKTIKNGSCFSAPIALNKSSPPLIKRGVRGDCSPRRSREFFSILRRQRRPESQTLTAQLEPSCKVKGVAYMGEGAEMGLTPHC